MHSLLEPTTVNQVLLTIIASIAFGALLWTSLRPSPIAARARTRFDRENRR